MIDLLPENDARYLIEYYMLPSFHRTLKDYVYTESYLVNRMADSVYNSKQRDELADAITIWTLRMIFKR